MSKAMLEDETYRFQFLNWNLASNAPCCSINLEKSQGFEFSNDRNRLLGGGGQLGSAVDVIDIHITDDDNDVFDILKDSQTKKERNQEDDDVQDVIMDDEYPENVSMFKQGYKLS